jgi:6-phosphogluconolactonase
MDQTRRTLLRGAAALAAPLVARPQTARRTTYAYVGCYTTPERRGRGDGIHVYKVDPQTGALTHLHKLGDLMNPSFLITSRDQRFLYSVHGDGTYATSFSVDKETGALKKLNQGATGGSNGVHQAIDASGKFMVVANYGTGTVAVLPVKPDGTLGDYLQLVELKGQPGPHRVEQASSHPHDIIFDPSGRFVVVPDKGLDRVHVFRFEGGKLNPTEQGSVVSRAGSAPRHAAFHATLPVAWVLNEINSTVTTYHFDAQSGALKPAQILPSLPPDFTGDSTGAEIVVSPDGRFVYASNRGHDSVAMFAVDPKTGLLRSTGWVATQGKSPRFICFDPSQRFFYATNEIGDNIVSFRVDKASGKLTPTGHMIQQGSPVTIAFVVG